MSRSSGGMVLVERKLGSLRSGSFGSSKVMSPPRRTKGSIDRLYPTLVPKLRVGAGLGGRVGAPPAPRLPVLPGGVGGAAPRPCWAFPPRRGGRPPPPPPRPRPYLKQG